MTHRYYDPYFGRFLTRDPISYNGGINLYGYTANDPVNFVDPRGEFVWVICGAGVAFVISECIFGTVNLFWGLSDAGQQANDMRNGDDEIAAFSPQERLNRTSEDFSYGVSSGINLVSQSWSVPGTPATTGEGVTSFSTTVAQGTAGVNDPEYHLQIQKFIYKLTYEHYTNN